MEPTKRATPTPVKRYLMLLSQLIASLTAHCIFDYFLLDLRWIFNLFPCPPPTLAPSPIPHRTGIELRTLARHFEKELFSSS